MFDFPVGSVLIKTFAFAPDMRDPALNERYIETRLLIHKADGWVAYPYIWNKEQTEAVYSPVGGSQKIETISPEGKPLSIDYAVPEPQPVQGMPFAGRGRSCRSARVRAASTMSAPRA